ncbi:MAG: HAMP domain-containing sensor histidine kinase [Planctomycetia bacterium]|nr:HAMP domain-containing sensor histidine kinase [Planctomycetia bacterium]
MNENRVGAEQPLWDAKFEERVLNSLAEFAAGAGHELNNPLAIISTLAQTLLLEETDQQRRRYLAQIIEQTQRGYEMIASVRAFARPPQPQSTQVDAREFFENWRIRERKRYADSDVAVEVLAPNYQSQMIQTDPAMLGSILDALVRNAAEATQLQGRVTLFTEVLDNGSESELTFGVEDDGPGIAPETCELLFSPFYSGRQAGRGLGFGLSKAWRFAERLNARLDCKHALNSSTGRRWLLILPLVNAEARERVA